ncbi:MAG TPA: oligopeptide/dipeptide ABC transporter ATP-binding protein, partial [Chloroflexota bacterium]|nr:oligopeptide/dipeptide ABC transporter ATP-binding protein [Chloroflexota bacterium]
MNNGPVLELDRLEIAYRTETGWLEPVRKVSLRVQPHEKYGLVGESGSGKTTLALGVMRYLPANGRVRGGHVFLNGTDLLRLSESEMRRTWGGQIGMVYQNPSTALNPALAIGDQIAEVAQIHLKLPRKDARAKAIEMLGRVRMPDAAAVAARYPHQLSGGMLQRALIAMALTSNPQLLIMDEPTTALDVTTEAVVLDMIQSLSQEYGSAILYITHNLGVVARICDRVGVMYAGEMMEEAPVGDLFRRPLHPYTSGLIGCAPNLDSDKRLAELNTIPGYIPRLDELPEGCIFAPRCAFALDRCRQSRPAMVEVAPGRFSACLRWQELDSFPLPLGEGQGEGTEAGHKTPPYEMAKGAGLTHDSALSTQHSAPNPQPPTPNPLLEARDVTKYFKSGGLGVSFLSGLESPPVKAVDGISVELPRGLTLGIVGESGCGKTTFGRCIVGLESPTEGEIKLGDEPLA